MCVCVYQNTLDIYLVNIPWDTHSIFIKLTSFIAVTNTLIILSLHKLNYRLIFTKTSSFFSTALDNEILYHREAMHIFRRILRDDTSVNDKQQS